MRRIVEKFLHRNSYFQIPSKDLGLHLLSHPDHPSMKSITDTLDYFRIDNIAVEIPKENFADLPDLFIAQLNEQEKHALALVEKKEGKVILDLDKGDRRKITTDEFMDRWTGKVIAIEQNREAGRRASHRPDLVLVLLALSFASLLYFSTGAMSTWLAILSLGGLAVSYLVVKEEVGVHSRLSSKVCGALSAAGSCSGVINSKNGKLFGTILLSDLSVTFFVSTTLIYTLLGTDYWLGITILGLSIPVILFALYQQAVVLKQWCALCLAAAGIVVLQGGFVFGFPAPVNIAYLVQSTFIFLLVYSVWSYGKPLLVSHLKLPKVEFEFLKFKRNQKLFLAVLEQDEIADSYGIPDEYRLHFGALEPSLTLKGITNPLCGFCVDAFKSYDKILQGSDRVAVEIIFSVPHSKPDNQATQVAIRVIEIYHSKGREEAWAALRQWYHSRDVEAWREEFGKPGEDITNELEYLVQHKAWCNSNDITYTPATVIERYKFPMEYNVQDLPMLVADMTVERNAPTEAEPVGV